MPIETTTDDGVRPLGAAGILAPRAWPKWLRIGSGSRTMSVLGWIAGIALALYVGVSAMMYFAQRSLIYFPETIHTTPAGTRYRRFSLPSIMEGRISPVIRSG